MKWLYLLLFISPAFWAGCIADVGSWEAMPPADAERFRLEVQPILADRCANPGCHGNDVRPFRVYAPLRHRMNPADLYLNTPLSPAELESNFADACAFMIGMDGPRDSALLLKPLPAAAGGLSHGGGVIFEDDMEPEFQILSSWVKDSIDYVAPQEVVPHEQATP